MLTSGRLPRRSSSPSGERSCGLQHPHVLRRLRRPGNPHASAGAGLHEYVSRPLRRVSPWEGRGQGVDRRRRRLRNRARQAGRDQRRLHPHAGREVPRRQGRRRRPRDQEQITRAIDASPSLRNKKDLIEEFVDSVSASGDMELEWKAYIAAKRDRELDAIIDEESLRPEETRALVSNAFRDGGLPTGGTALTRILPPMSRFAPDGAHSAKRHTVIGRRRPSSTATSASAEVALPQARRGSSTESRAHYPCVHGQASRSQSGPSVA